MTKRILILDDDTEFNQLLTDIFRQADYEVESSEAGLRALELMAEAAFDLVVVDHRLPQMSGLEFVREIKNKGYQLPILMVSGYLDNDTIRDLIRLGVSGIFIKPLNIFSLLKKAGDVIESFSFHGQTGGGEAAGEVVGKQRLSCFPCLSEKGREFQARLIEQREFSRNLLVIGPEGMPFAAICRDIVRLGGQPEGVVMLHAGNITEALLLREAQPEPEWRRLTLCVMDADNLGDSEVQLLMGLTTPEGGPQVRMIFVFTHSVESLYDAGRLGEEFYLFLGSNELQVPPLREMPEDIVALAEQEIRGLSLNWKLDVQVKNLLCRHEWKENIEELRGLILRAATLARPGVPELRHFELALEQDAASEGHGVEGAARGKLEAYLYEERRRHEVALSILMKR